MAANCSSSATKSARRLWAERPEAPFFREGLRNERVFWSSRLWRFVTKPGFSWTADGWQGLKPNYLLVLYGPTKVVP